jgi:hypothetical protein
MKLSKIKLSVLFGIMALLAVFVCVKVLRADTNSNTYGYAWSSNIGWIKLNDCDNPATDSTCVPSASYGMSVLPSAPGTITGYAWSSNIGWITFNNSGCPSATVPGCTAGAHADWDNVNNNVVTIHGWARACSVYASGCSGTLKDNAFLGSWDGYIALDSVTAGGSSGTWGLSIGADNKIGGFAWGSEVIGWVKGWTSALYVGPHVTITPNPVTINKGGSSTLTVTASTIDGASSCTIAGAPLLTMTQGSGGVWTGTVSVSPIKTTIYTVTCTHAAQTASASTQVNVNYVVLPPGGSGYGGYRNDGGYCAVTYPQLAWAADATACTISEQGGGSTSVAVNSQADGGTQGTDGLYYSAINLPVIGNSAVYTLQCTGGSAPVSASVTVTACQKDFTISVAPAGANFVPSTDGKTMTATYIVSITPQNGFTSPIALTVASYPNSGPNAMPKSTTFTFDTPTLTYSGSTYNSAVMTITVATPAIKKSVTYSPIMIQGVGNGLTRQAAVAAGATVTIKPIFKEF